MSEIAYVNQEWSNYAREVEHKFAVLPTEAGVLFVSVGLEPSTDGIPKNVNVYLGISRDLDTKTGMALVDNILKRLDPSLTYSCTVIRGVPGNARSSKA